MIEGVPRICILASGSGSTSELIFPFAGLIITDTKKAGIIERAAAYEHLTNRRLPVFILPRTQFYVQDSQGQIDNAATDQKWGEKMAVLMQDRDTEMVVSAGYNRLIHQAVYGKFPTFNSHPAPLEYGRPDFGGEGMHGNIPYLAVLYFYHHINRPFKDEVSIHQVTGQFDKGRVYSWREIDIEPDDTAETLQNRLKLVEAQHWYEFLTGPARSGNMSPKIRAQSIVLPGEEGIWKESIDYALSFANRH